MMNKKLITVVAALSLGAPLMSAAQEFGAAATVNGVEISRERVRIGVDGMLKAKGTNIGAVRDPERMIELRTQVLDVLIGQEVLYQEAERKKSLASAADVDQAIKEFRNSFADERELKLSLENNGFTLDSYTEDTRRRLSAKKYIEDHIQEGVSISKQEVEQFYQDNPDSFKLPERIRARHILLSLDSKAEISVRQQVRARMEKLSDRVTRGEDFAKLAQEFSEDSGSAQRGGDLGLFARGVMVPTFEQAAFALQIGEVSGIVESPFGLHLIKLEEHQPPSKAPLNEDVRRQVHQYLRAQKTRQAVAAKVEALRAQAKVEVY